MMLAGIGSIAVAFGLFVAVFTVTHAPAEHKGIQMPGMIYVGANTCYTCHKNQEHNWSQLVGAQEVVHPVANPQSTTLEVNVKADAAPLLIGNIGAADDATYADWHDTQHYVIATEEGSVIVPNRKPASKDCTDCGDSTATPQTSENPRLDALAVTCTICHLRHTAPTLWRSPNVRAQYG